MTSTTPPEAGRRSRTTTLVLAIVLPIVVLVLVVAAGAAALFTVTARSVDLRYSAPAAPNVQIVVPTARIEVLPVQGSTVTVAVTGRAGLVEPRFDVGTTGSVTRIAGGCRPPWFGFCDLRVRVGVPAGSDLSVQDTNGAVVVRDLTGSVDASTTNGAVSLTGLTGDVSATSTNGQVEVLAGSSATVVAGTTNGAVRLEFSSPPRSVHATSTNGAVTVRVPADGTTYAVQASTVNGGIGGDVTNDPSSSRSITASTVNGRITVEHLR
ncbi:MAG: DUF4097 family beta strand repeat-containing protein [Amnibacterium sp.]